MGNGAESLNLINEGISAHCVWIQLTYFDYLGQGGNTGVKYDNNVYADDHDLGSLQNDIL